jgi:hypothetical protein
MEEKRPRRRQRETMRSMTIEVKGRRLRLSKMGGTFLGAWERKKCDL